jgi:hypothetical protein
MTLGELKRQRALQMHDKDKDTVAQSQNYQG